MNTTPTFHHTDPGTPEHIWLQDPRWDHTPTLNTTTLFTNHTHLVVASAHPDDETLGAGLLIQEAHRAGLHITILVATNGEASHPHSPTWTANMLSTARHNELHEAINTLAPGATITHLNLPDSKLAHHHNHLIHTLTTTTNKHTILLAPYPKDGHTDHDTLGAAAHTAATTTGALLMHYPLWLWHWGTPNDLPWNNTITLPATPHTLTTKKTALAKHRTQTQPLSPLPGDEPIITPNVTTRAHRLIETFILTTPTRTSDLATPPTPPDPTPFTTMYTHNNDPWNFENSYYETRKRALLTAILRQPTHNATLEIGCADGRLTKELAKHTHTITGIDINPTAIKIAQQRGIPAATFITGATPHDLPEGPYDLIINSEIGYYLTPHDWLATLRHCRRILTAGGQLILAHWQHPTTNIPLDGPHIHAQAATLLDLPHTAQYRDADLTIDIYGGPTSIAKQENR